MMAGHARDTLRPLATSAGSQVLVLPTLGKSFVLYPLVSVSGNNGKLPSPSEALEIMSRVLRRARLSGLDVLSGTWHSLTTSPNGQNSLYRLGLKAFGAGKQGSSALSFFRSLPRNSNDKALKILYPESVPVRDIQIQVALWLKDSRNYKRQAVLWALALPPVAIAAKTLLWSPIVTLLLATHVFHAASLFKAHAGSRYLGRMLSERRVVWTSSEALTAFLNGPSPSASIVEDGPSTATETCATSPATTLTDEQLKALEETLGLADLSRSYRRATLESWMRLQGESSKGPSKSSIQTDNLS